MKKIIKYMMHKNNENNLIVPYFVSDGGYFPLNGEFIGMSEDDSAIYLPDSVDVLTNELFIAHVVSLTMVDPITDETLTTEQKTAIANAWLSEKNGN